MLLRQLTGGTGTCDELGIHEHLLDAAFPASEKLFEPGKRELRIERLRAELPDLGSNRRLQHEHEKGRALADQLTEVIVPS